MTTQEEPRSIRIDRRLAAVPVGRPAFPDLLEVPEVAERLRCTPGHVYALMSRGQMGYVKVGRKRLITADELLGFIARNSEAAAS